MRDASLPKKQSGNKKIYLRPQQLRTVHKRGKPAHPSLEPTTEGKVFVGRKQTHAIEYEFKLKQERNADPHFGNVSLSPMRGRGWGERLFRRVGYLGGLCEGAGVGMSILAYGGIALVYSFPNKYTRVRPNPVPVEVAHLNLAFISTCVGLAERRRNSRFDARRVLESLLFVIKAVTSASGCT
ncbi:hypothetical protein BOTBODRAFT_144336 [Botryobasidium botryosum FD-172 SS1]|uniref:Uncharacterized protein n=1 Tax=Botryobasidium botryosum (strain FD-172 SS1) TaxID=930990 RepID=A0A067MQN1_BOTB1|nr:hypothetical protein BOTBODRAFT_144336 [Botryobasidium botryosum FD-172 SS1]